MQISVVVPAFNEQQSIVQTLTAIREWNQRVELILVDDGSKDRTLELARPLVDKWILHERNRGKGKALSSGWKQAGGDIILFLDADLGETARYGSELLDPIKSGEADMVIACLPRAKKKGGFGLVKGLARFGIRRLSGYHANAPLSGQRAIRREVLTKVGGLAEQFGIEVGLTIDVAQAGFRIVEKDVPFHHRETGRDVKSFLHRGKEFYWVGKTLFSKWRALRW